MAVYVSNNLCVGCGTARKTGDRKLMFNQVTDTIQNLYESILPCCRDTDKVCKKTIKYYGKSDETDDTLTKTSRQTHKDILFQY